MTDEYKPCRYKCGINITFNGKIEGKKGSTGWFERDGTEHTYLRCEKILEELKRAAVNTKLF